MGRPLTAAHARGITLIELMIAIAILGTLAAIALPAYRGYVETAAEGVLAAEIATMEPFQQDARMRTGSYGTGTWNSPAGDTSLADAIGWEPRNPHGATYVVLADQAGYRVTATDPEGRSVCRIMPARRAC